MNFKWKAMEGSQWGFYSKGNQGKELVFELGLAISQDPIVGISWNLEGFLSTHQRNCGQKIEVFGWIDCEIIDALVDLEKRRPVLSPLGIFVKSNYDYGHWIFYVKEASKRTLSSIRVATKAASTTLYFVLQNWWLIKMNFNEEASLGIFIHNTWHIHEASLSRNWISTTSHKWMQ